MFNSMYVCVLLHTSMVAYLTQNVDICDCFMLYYSLCNTWRTGGQFHLGAFS